MLTDKERAHIVKEFFDRVISKDLIVYKPFSRFSRKTKLIQYNTDSSGHVYFEFKKIFDEPEKLQQFCDHNETQFGIRSDYSRGLIKNFFLFHALNYIESYKLFFIEILKQDVGIGKRKIMIGPKTELGTLVISLSQELNYKNFEKLFPKEFRNILGHSSWWWIRDLIEYEVEDKKHQITLKQFEESMKEFSDNMNAMIKEYQERLDTSRDKLMKEIFHS